MSPELIKKYVKRGNKKPATVGELIEILSELPKKLPCYVRPKYHGNLSEFEDAPINVLGISDMETNGKISHVTFLL